MKRRKALKLLNNKKWLWKRYRIDSKKFYMYLNSLTTTKSLPVEQGQKLLIKLNLSFRRVLIKEASNENHKRT